MDSHYKRSIRLHVGVGFSDYKYIIVNIRCGPMASDKVWKYVINWESVLYKVYIAMGCERAVGLHVPVREELWPSDEPKRDVCIFVTDVRDVLKRQILDNFRDICCAGRLDLATSGKSELRWNITNRFVYPHCYPRLRWLCSTNIAYLCCCRQSGGLCLINIECCRGCCQLCQLRSIKI